MPAQHNPRPLRHLTLDTLVERVNQARDFGYDDEAEELTRRLRPNGRGWYWTHSDTRVVICDYAERRREERRRRDARADPPVTLARPTVPPPPERAVFYAQVAHLTSLEDEALAREFVAARRDRLVRPARPEDLRCRVVSAGRGLYTVTGDGDGYYVALIGTAEIEGGGIAAARAAGQIEQLLIAVCGAPNALHRTVLATPAASREEIARHYVHHKGLGRRVEAWVVPRNRAATMTLAIPALRAPRSAVDERELHAARLATVQREHPEFLAELLPFPASAYEPAFARAIAETPARYRPYAREVVRASLSGERTQFSDVPPPHRTDATPQSAAHVRRRIDRAIDETRFAHLAVGAAVKVRCWEDEETRPGTITALQHGASAIGIDVDYPPGYRSPRRVELITNSNYPLERIVDPANPLHELAYRALYEPLTPRRFG